MGSDYNYGVYMDKREYRKVSNEIEKKLKEVRNNRSKLSLCEKDILEKKKHIEDLYVQSQKQYIMNNLYVKEEYGKKHIYYVLDVNRGHGYVNGYPTIDTTFIRVTLLDNKVIEVCKNTFGKTMWLENIDGTKNKNVEVIRCSDKVQFLMDIILTNYLECINSTKKKKR